jgi:Leucine-rich repeat (LRR) protein
VRDAIVAAVPGVNSANDVTEAHLAAITTLRVNAPPNQAVRPITFRIGDFSGLTTLTNLEMERWSGVSLPDGIFDGLNALERVSLYSSGLRSIPNSVLGLTSLKSLNIGSHGITSIPAGTFD